MGNMNTPSSESLPCICVTILGQGTFLPRHRGSWCDTSAWLKREKRPSWARKVKDTDVVDFQSKASGSSNIVNTLAQMGAASGAVSRAGYRASSRAGCSRRFQSALPIWDAAMMLWPHFIQLFQGGMSHLEYWICLIAYTSGRINVKILQDSFCK